MRGPAAWMGALRRRGNAPKRGVLVAAPPRDTEPPILTRFSALVAETRPASVLEIGTLQAIPGRPTHHQSVFPWVPRSDYVMADVQAGQDVDVVADLHGLPQEWAGRFGAFVAMAVFEHLERPWIAAREVARVLAPGGLFLVGTHQCFPLHGFPQDFFRFSKEALSLIFADAGLEILEASYSERCKIVPPDSIVLPHLVDSWNANYPSYVMVSALGRKSA